MPKTTVRLHPSAAPSLKDLQRQLHADFGLKATYEDIVGALIWGTPAPQTAGMLMAFTRSTTASDHDAPATSDERE